MEHGEFRVKAKEMVDYIADYLENIRSTKVYPSVQPGFLHKRLPTEAPVEGEPWDHIMKDFDEIVKPGLVHWQSPHMHAYFPALTSYPSILGEMLSAGINNICFTWASSPAGTELETISMNWLGKAIGLPDVFLNEKDDSHGGGVIQTTASEATLVSLLAARTTALIELQKLNPDMQSSELLGHLIAYCSDQAHSSVEKAGLIGLVRMRYIESDENNSMRGDKLEEAILADKARGLVPFWVCATLGSTGTTAFDNLREVGTACERHSAWLHIDCAYAGTAFFCPEYRHWLDGIELADSIAFNPSKWMLVNFDCTAMWVKDSAALHRTFNVNPIYLRHENSGKAIDYMFGSKKSKSMKKIRMWDTNIKNPINGKVKLNGYIGGNEGVKIEEITTDNIIVNGNHISIINGGENIQLYEDNAEDDLYGNDNLYEENAGLHGYNKIAPGCTTIQSTQYNKNDRHHWQIPLSRRFRALKLWFVLRSYGIAGIQKHVRESVRLAQKLEALVRSDPRFEIPQARNLGLVPIRLKGDNTITERLFKRINARGNLHCVPACFKDIYVIRYVVTSPKTTNQDILDDWTEIKTVASDVLVEMFGTEDGNIVKPKRPRISLKETRELNEKFGTSLLLANSPMSPKIMNGTHAAICDYDQVLNTCAQIFTQLKMEPKDSPGEEHQPALLDLTTNKPAEMRRRIRGIKSCGKKFSLDSAMDLVQGLVQAGHELPLCTEEDKEDASNGSSPCDRSSLSSSPVSTFGAKQDLNVEFNELLVPPTPSRQYRSKSVDVNLTGLNFEDAKITIDMKNNEIIITPTASKSFIEDDKKLFDIEEKLNIGDKISEAFENFQDGLQMLNEYRQNEDKDDQCNAKVTIKGPGSYIKKLIQQFSEGPFETEDSKPEADRAVSTQSIKDRADAICKKCLHYKGKLTK